MPIYSLNERRVEFRGAHHFIARDATLAGSILLENDVGVWFGVVIRADNDQVHIGAGSLVGANALIPEGKAIPPGVLVGGTPGKVVRELRPEEKEGLLEIARGYVERSKLFLRQLREQPLPPSAR